MLKVENLEVFRSHENLSGFRCSREIVISKIAKEVGLDVNGAYLCAYMLARFGPPNFPSDPDKDLCSWLLATDFPGIWLLVTPHIGDEVGDEPLSFTVFVTEDLDMRLTGRTAENLKAFKDWTRRAAQWIFDHAALAPSSAESSIVCISSSMRAPLGDPTAPVKVRLNHPSGEWILYRKGQNPGRAELGTDLSPGDVGSLEEWVASMEMDCLSEIQTAYAKETGDRFSGWNPCPKAVAEVVNALSASFMDLKRLVFVRDLPFNPSGLLIDQDPASLGHADRYDNSGVPMEARRNLSDDLDSTV